MKTLFVSLIALSSLTAFAQTISASQAADIALERYPNDAVIEVDFDRENGRPVWDVDLRSGLSVYVDATSGNIFEVERDGRDWDAIADWDDDRNDWDDWDDDWDDMPVVDTAISAEQAQQIALGRYPNTQAFDIDLERERGRLLWDVELTNGLAVYVDATSGNIIEIEPLD
jgi:uncharacterized membrane protein YkoI